MLAFAAGAAHAQTTSNGPYYATPSWDQQLPAFTRFIVLSNWDSQAVLDRETGLVWEQGPSGVDTWLGAQLDCAQKSVGNRLGWRLATIQELASLIDPTIPFPGPKLPAGHPFSNVRSENYWSATTSARNASSALLVLFDVGFVGSDSKTNANIRIWCVRGGQGVDPQ